MPFAAEPLIAGDLHEGAAKLAAAAQAELLRLPDAPARLAALRRWWDEAAKLGWPALFIPEASGGAGGALEDVVALVDGAARDALPLPVASLCGVLPVLLGADPDRTAALAAAVAAGEAVACPVLDGCQGWTRAADRPRATLQPDGGLVLDGVALGVETPPTPTEYLLACAVADANGSETGLVRVPAAALRDAPRLFERVDGRLSADLAFAGITLPPEALLTRGPHVARRAQAALELGAFLCCVEAASALGAALERVIAYLNERKQFGAALSSFQALRHKVVETYTTYETLRGVVQHLLRGAGPDGLPNGREVALAKLHGGRAARVAAQTIIQLHGGMGMTEELPATRLNNRLMMAEFEYGDAAWHARQLLRAA